MTSRASSPTSSTRSPCGTPRSSCAGRVWDVVRDEVDLGDAGHHVREYVRHPGAVAVARARRRGPGLPHPAVPPPHPHPRLGGPGGPARRRGRAALGGRGPRAARGGRPRRRPARRPARPPSLPGWPRRGDPRLPRARPHFGRRRRPSRPRGGGARYAVVPGSRSTRRWPRCSRAASRTASSSRPSSPPTSPRERGWSTLRPHDAPWPQGPGGAASGHDPRRPAAEPARPCPCGGLPAGRCAVRLLRAVPRGGELATDTGGAHAVALHGIRRG